jgi:hypothetical protein
MGTLQNGLQLVNEHKGATAAIVGGSALLIGGAVALSMRKNKKRSKSSKRTLRHKTKAHRKQKSPHTAGKRKDTSRRRIRFTKNNQPYKQMVEQSLSLKNLRESRESVREGATN